MVTSGPATSGEKELRRDWPITEGLIAGTTKQEGTKPFLEIEEEDLTDPKERVGL